MFTSPQIVLFCDDVEQAAQFYRRLGFAEELRSPDDGPPRHVDLTLDGMRLGITGRDPGGEDHGVPTSREPDSAALVLWCDDADAGYAALVDAGAKPLAEPHPFLDELRVAWARDPDGHLLQLVQRTD